VNFADTNWLVSIYVRRARADLEVHARWGIVDRFMRRSGDRLAISQVVLLESRNVFSRATGEAEPEEWRRLQADFGGRIYVDSMNWDLLRRECNSLFAKYAWKIGLGTFDSAIVASAKLAGATQFLSFDQTARILAFAEGITVFPVLDGVAKREVARLKR